MVANSARGQLNGETYISPVPVHAWEFGLTRRVRRPRLQRQPVVLISHTQTVNEYYCYSSTRVFIWWQIMWLERAYGIQGYGRLNFEWIYVLDHLFVRALSLRNLVLGQDCGRFFPAGLSPTTVCFSPCKGWQIAENGQDSWAFLGMHETLDVRMLARAPASSAQGPHRHGPRIFLFMYIRRVPLRNLGLLIKTDWSVIFCPPCPLRTLAGSRW